jgi:hypothetical protein
MEDKLKTQNLFSLKMSILSSTVPLHFEGSSLASVKEGYRQRRENKMQEYM